MRTANKIVLEKVMDFYPGKYIPTIRGKLLFVENDPDIADLTGWQSVQPPEDLVSEAGDAASALKHPIQTPPDRISATLNLPGRSGKDLITALNAQGVKSRLIVIEKSQEADAIQAFRLGATDVMFCLCTMQKLEAGQITPPCPWSTPACSAQFNTQQSQRTQAENIIKPHWNPSVRPDLGRYKPPPTPLHLVLTEMPGALNGAKKKDLEYVQSALQRLSRSSEKTIVAPLKVNTPRFSPYKNRI